MCDYAYTTPDSAVSHRLHRLLVCDARMQPKIVKTVPARAVCGLSVATNDAAAHRHTRDFRLRRLGHCDSV